MVAVLFPISAEEPKLEDSTLEELASLGITSVALSINSRRELRSALPHAEWVPAPA